MNNETCSKKNGYACSATLETTVSDGFTLVAVGDVILTRPLSEKLHPGIGEIHKILQSSDVTFANFEGSIFDSRKANCYPNAEYGGAYHISHPSVGHYLKEMGVDIVSHANNHTLDWGIEGMRETQRAFDENNILYAGSGETHSQASAPRFFETPKGRVALVAYTSSAPESFRAADPVHCAPGRPGVSCIRIKQYLSVTEDLLNDLRRVRDAVSLFPAENDDPDVVRIALQLQEMVFKRGDVCTRCAEENLSDVEKILWNIRNGKQLSDFLIVSDHTHEPGNWYQLPPNYQPAMVHRFIDAGADAFIGHGSHHLRGIEIYKGKPIFYGLGDFIMDDLRTPVGMDMYESNGLDPRDSTDADVTAKEMSSGYVGTPGFESPIFYESVIAKCIFNENRITNIYLYPIELHQKERFANRGIPGIVKGNRAEVILRRLQDLSAEFGTQIQIQDDVGVIAL